MSTGPPNLTPADQAAMAEFWREFQACAAAIDAEMLRVVATIPEFAAVLEQMPPAQRLAETQRSRSLQEDALVHGNWAPYMENARIQGATYAKMGIRFATWFELLTAFQRILLPEIAARHPDDPGFVTRVHLATTHFIHLAMGIIGDEYLRTKEEINRRQQQAILELSTPVLQVRDRMLILPIIGVVDSTRARQLTEQLLHAIRAKRAKVVVMDITGVPAVDSKVANHLVQTVEAARLMGATVVVTGLSADVAQALVTLGLDLSKLNTVGDLQGGMEEAERLLQASAP